MTKITAEDRILIGHLRINERWGARRMTNEFPNTASSIASVSRVVSSNGDTTKRKPGSGIDQNLPCRTVSG